MSAPVESPSNELLKLLPTRETVALLLIEIRKKAYEAGYRAAREVAHADTELTSATTYGAGYNAGYQDAERGLRKATG